MATSTLSPTPTPTSTSTSSFPQTKENTIRVYKDRASYDHQTIHTILSSTLFSTISFITTSPEDGEPMPFSLPMTAVAGSFPPQNERNQLPENDGSEEEYMRDQEGCPEGGFDVYLHGNSAMLLAKMAKTGSLRVVVSSTKVDGVILHFAPNGHSLNYRSCVIHGDAVPVTSAEEKRYAMHLLTNHMSRRRWSATNPVAPEAMKSLQVVKVVIRSASAKIRATNINGLEKAGFGDRDDVWTGAVPVYEVLGEPVASGYFDESQRPVQRQVEDWMDRRNTTEREYAERVARVGIALPAEVVVKARGGSRVRA